MNTTTSVSIIAETERYTVHLANDPEDVCAAQRLRFEVFNVELGEGLAASVESGLDADEFDAICDHLIVSERATGAVVGTYRLQTGRAALISGFGYYSEREFDFAPFEAARGELVELGRACVAADHRNQTVLGLLWRGIANYAESRGARYLIGCGSFTAQDPALGLAAWEQFAPVCGAPAEWRTTPLDALRCVAPAADVQRLVGTVKMPRLMGAYLTIGARLCGEPALDREFKTIDFLTWLDLKALSPRVLRKFF